jgi:hypothetical protein
MRPQVLDLSPLHVENALYRDARRAADAAAITNCGGAGPAAENVKFSA